MRSIQLAYCKYRVWIVHVYILHITLNERGAQLVRSGLSVILLLQQSPALQIEYAEYTATASNSMREKLEVGHLSF